ncbi:putative glycolipid-binding domain-containing protein [Nocardia sp. NPDC050412]|uniref:putative glycolipid-binding domain-containing protein n=1 Tax=Nocardia sp. NPDC050412 TaxID=3364320 RepID=UPI00378CDF95
MTFLDLPSVASWRHVGARTGFEVAYFTADHGGRRVAGVTTATEGSQSWIVDYVIDVDQSWLTRSARITGRTEGVTRTIVIEADGMGHWQIDGVPAPHLRGCLDLDLEASAVTNTFPVHRLSLPIGHAAAAPAAYVRAVGLAVDHLEQTYSRASEQVYDYAAPAFDFACSLTYDQHGLILDYPGIATRVQ